MSAEHVIVVGHEGAEHGADALALAATYARAVGGRIVVCGWYREESPVFPGSDDLERELAHLALEPLEQIQTELLHVPVELQAVGGRSPAHALHKLAEERHADLIVVGSTHRGRLGRVLPGSTGQRLLQEAPCAVAVAPRGYADGTREVKSIAVAFEPSLEGRSAVALAGELAAAAHASLLLVTVVDSTVFLYGGGVPPETYQALADERRASAQRAQDEVIAALPAGVRAAGVVLDGAVIPELIGAVKDGVDMVVTGSRAYGPVGRVLAGSVSGALLREAPCPVVIVPRAVAARSAGERDLAEVAS